MQRLITIYLLIYSIGIGTSCGDIVPISPDAEFAVMVTAPADATGDVAIDAAVSVTFTRPIDATTVTGQSFFVTDSAGRSLPGAVTAGETTAQFTADAPMGLLGRYTATVTAEIRDTDGNGLAADYSWSFVIRDGSWGEPRLIESNNAGSAFEPDIAMNEGGDALVVWRQFDGTSTNAWANYYSAGAWGEAALIETDDAGSVGQAAVALGNDGVGVTAWAQGTATTVNSIWANRWTEDSGWGAAALIETDDAGNAQMPEIACDPSGGCLAVWQQYDGTRFNIWSNRAAATGGWDNAALIESDDAGYALDPRLAMDTSGNALAVWSQFDGTAYRIWGERYVAGAGWNTPERLDMSAGTVGAGQQQLAMNRSGNALAVWQSSLGIGRARFAPAAGWSQSELLPGEADVIAESPQVALGDGGVALIAWTTIDSTQNGGGSVQVVRYTPETGWSAPAVLSTELGSRSNQGASLRVAVDAQGNGIAVWRQSDKDVGGAGGDGSLWISRYVEGTGWSAAEQLSAQLPTPGNAESASLAISPRGSAIVVWSQSDGTRQNIYGRVFR